MTKVSRPLVGVKRTPEQQCARVKSPESFTPITSAQVEAAGRVRNGLVMVGVLSSLPFCDHVCGWSGSISQLASHVERVTGKVQNRGRVARTVAELVEAGVLLVWRVGRSLWRRFRLVVPGTGCHRSEEQNQPTPPTPPPQAESREPASPASTRPQADESGDAPSMPEKAPRNALDELPGRSRGRGIRQGLESLAGLLGTFLTVPATKPATSLSSGFTRTPEAGALLLDTRPMTISECEARRKLLLEQCRKLSTVNP